MKFRQTFSERFKLLRTSHQLSVKLVANLLNIKSTSNITYWEQQKNIPSLDVFDDIVYLFGVWQKKKKRLEYRFKPPVFFVLSVCFRLANECILILLRTF